MTRDFVLDKKNLQREQKQGVPGYLTTLAYLVVLFIVAGITAALAIGLRRMDRDRERKADRGSIAASAQEAVNGSGAAARKQSAEMIR
jgi:hypothetical protein